MPILYVEAVPTRVDAAGQIEHVGVLLRGSAATGQITRTLVSGRVFHGESIRDALQRNIEKDLGPAAFPAAGQPGPVHRRRVLPAARRHPAARPASARRRLVYVVPVTGECNPRQDALELTWLTPKEALEPSLLADLEGGRGQLLKQALAWSGALV